MTRKRETVNQPEEETAAPSDEGAEGVTYRTIVKGAAWSVPVIAAVTEAPSA